MVEKLQNLLGLDIRYIVKSSSFIFLKYVTISVTSFLTSILFARFISKDIYGQYQSIYATLSILSIFSMPGFNLLAIREVSRNNPKSVLTIIRASVLFSCLAIPMLIILGILNSAKPSGAILLICSTIFPFYYGLNTWYTFYEGDKNFFQSSILAIILNFVTTLTLAALILIHSPLGSLIFIPLLINTTIQFIFVLEVKKKAANTKLKPFNFKYGFTSTIQKATTLVVENSAALIIPVIYLFQNLAEYQIAYTITNVFTGLFTSLSAVYLPLLFKYKKFHFQKIIVQNLLTGIMLFVFARIAVQVLFVPIYGTKYIQSLQLLELLLLILVITPLKIFLINFLTAKEKNGAISIINLISISTASIIFFLNRNTVFSTNILIFFFTNQILSFVSLLIYFRFKASEKIPSILEESF